MKYCCSGRTFIFNINSLFWRDCIFIIGLQRNFKYDKFQIQQLQAEQCQKKCLLQPENALQDMVSDSSGLRIQQLNNNADPRIFDTGEENKVVFSRTNSKEKENESTEDSNTGNEVWAKSCKFHKSEEQLDFVGSQVLFSP